MGIEPEHRARLGQAFERGIVPTDRQDSRGLGLPFTERVGLAHGRHLLMSPNEPTKISVRMELPATHASPAPTDDSFFDFFDDPPTTRRETPAATSRDGNTVSAATAAADSAAAS